MLMLSGKEMTKTTYKIPAKKNYYTRPWRSFFRFHRLCQIDSNCSSKQLRLVLNITTLPWNVFNKQ